MKDQENKRTKSQAHEPGRLGAQKFALSTEYRRLAYWIENRLPGTAWLQTLLFGPIKGYSRPGLDGEHGKEASEPLSEPASVLLAGAAGMAVGWQGPVKTKDGFGDGGRKRMPGEDFQGCG